MGQIAIALKHLMAAGVEGDALLQAVEEMEAAAPKVVDESAERRREKDRERKRKAREDAENSDDSADVRGNPQMSAEQTATPLPPPLSPKPPNSPPISPPATISADVRRVDVAFQQFVAAANRQPAWPVPKALNKTRRTKLAARLRDHGLEEWGRAIERAERSTFLTGQTKNPFSLSLDWLVEPKNLLKVMEGNYDDRTAKLRPIEGGRASGSNRNRDSLAALDRFIEPMAQHADGKDAGGYSDAGAEDERTIDAQWSVAAG